MKLNVRAEILMFTLLGGLTALGQPNAPEFAQLARKVEQLEKQVQEIQKLLEPLRAQQTADARRRTLRERFDRKMAHDRQKYSREQLREAESLYQVANQKWGSTEASESLDAMIKKYPDINRTGCAVLYVAQNSTGADRAKYLRDCIEKFEDCFYGDGVQVGAYARFLLAEDYLREGQAAKAQVLQQELKEHYADAVDHSGALLVQSLKDNSH